MGWRQVLSPDDTILATSAATAPTPPHPTATVSSGGRTVRLWSEVDGSMVWETFLGFGGIGGAGGDPASTEPTEIFEGGAAGVVTVDGYVVVLSAGGIHVLKANSGALLAQWWCEPAREPDLAALVGLDVQVNVSYTRRPAGEK